MKETFDRYAWSAKLYKTHAAITQALREREVIGKKIACIHVIGTAMNLEPYSYMQALLNTCRNVIGIPYDDICSEKNERISSTQLPCAVKGCEPIVLVFEDGSTLELLPHAFSGIQIGVNKMARLWRMA